MDNFRPGQQNGMFHKLMRDSQDGGMNNSYNSPFGEENRQDLGSVHGMNRGGLMGGRMGGLIDSMKGGSPGEGASKYAKSLLKGAMERFTPENAPNQMTKMPSRPTIAGNAPPTRMGSPMQPRMGGLNRRPMFG